MAVNTPNSLAGLIRPKASLSKFIPKVLLSNILNLDHKKKKKLDGIPDNKKLFINYMTLNLFKFKEI